MAPSDFPIANRAPRVPTRTRSPAVVPQEHTTQILILIPLFPRLRLRLQLQLGLCKRSKSTYPTIW